MDRFFSHYKEVILNDLFLNKHFANKHRVPKLEKVVLNLGVKDITQDKRKILSSLLGAEVITGQRALITKSRKPLISLKVRKGMAVGCKVVLRKSLMYAFLDRFISITLPLVKNFQGFYQSLITMDGNLSLKLREPLSFLELEYEYDTFLELPPIDITFVTTSVGKKESLSLLSSLQVPFTK